MPVASKKNFRIRFVPLLVAVHQLPGGNIPALGIAGGNAFVKTHLISPNVSHLQSFHEFAVTTGQRELLCNTLSVSANTGALDCDPERIAMRNIGYHPLLNCVNAILFQNCFNFAHGIHREFIFIRYICSSKQVIQVQLPLSKNIN